MKLSTGGLVATALALSGLFSFTTAARATSASPVVVSDVQASTDPYGNAVTAPEQPNTEIEPSIAVNPSDPTNVVTAFQEGRVDGGGDKNNGFATSFDSGKTWTYGNLPGLTTSSTPPGPFDRASDAAVAWGVDPSNPGHYLAYVNSLVFDDTTMNALPSGMAVNVSKDGGKTWSTAAILEQDNVAGLNDKNWIVADNGSGTGHHPGRVYVIWDKVVANIVYSYCDPDVASSVVTGAGCDKLANWSNVQGNGWYTLTPVQGIGIFPVVLSDGSVGAVFNQESGAGCSVTAPPTDQPGCVAAGGNSLVWISIVHAGAVVWPAPLPAALAPVTITTYNTNGVTGQRAAGLPQAAVDPNTNEVYVAWEDTRFRTDDGSAAGSNTSNQNDAVVATSMPDAVTGLPGTTWSAPVRVNGGPTNDHVDHYNTSVAVGNDGIVRVAYRQRSEPAGFLPGSASYPIDTYYQESVGGASLSFSTPLLADITQNTVNPQFGAFSRGGLFEGDYSQVAAAGPDESYITRDEAFPATPGATCTTSFSTPGTCQNQQTFVAHIAPPPSANVPETRFIPGLALVGAAALVLVARRRRGTMTAPAD